MFFFFFFNDTATTEIYTLSLHDALPILSLHGRSVLVVDDNDTNRKILRYLTKSWGMTPTEAAGGHEALELLRLPNQRDRKSTRLNSSHLVISYAVFCLKQKKNT